MIIIGVIIGVIVLAIWRPIVSFLDKRKNKKEKHKKELSDSLEMHKKELIHEILNPLTLLDIKYDYKDFRKWIDGLEVLKEKGDLFDWAFQHLQSSEKYKVILPYLNKAKDFIEGLNSELSNLKLYLEENIKESDRKIIPYISKKMVRSVFFEDTDVDRIKIKEVKDKNIYIYRNKKDTFKIPCILYEKTEKLITEIIEQKEFLNQLKEIQRIDGNAKKELDKFTGTLKTFLKDIEHNYKLEGKCDKFSYLEVVD